MSGLKRVLSFSSAVLLSVLVLTGGLMASVPPHKRVLQMMKDGKIPTPFFLQHRKELLQRGVNAAWSSQALQRQRQLAPNAMQRSFGPQRTPSGSVNALVILVQFSDKPKQVVATSFDNLVFGTSSNTVRDYYRQVSYNSLDIVTVNLPSAIGWETAPQTYAYYVNGENGFGPYPQNAQKLTEDAVSAASGVVDFSKYDNDGDGYVDALFIVHAGPGAEFTGSNNDIWSHSWVTSTPLLYNGVYVYRYSMEPEYWAAPGDMTCGVYCHELGHALFGLPDLYDIDYSSAGLGMWSLMAFGSWGGPTGMGDYPSLPDAWCRFQMGYVAPTVLNSNQASQQIKYAEKYPAVYRLWGNGNLGNEYFLVENREQVGYDSYLPNGGLCIYHIDESVTTENEEEWYPGHTSYGHYLVALEQADGNFDLERFNNFGDQGDCYPGSSANRDFCVWSNPSSRDYFNNDTHVGVYNISNSDTTMTADLEVLSTSLSFTNITMMSGITTSGGDIGFAWGDFNSDGQIDLFQSGGTGPLYRNIGNGVFTTVTPPATSLYGAVWADFNGDGKLDLLFPSATYGSGMPTLMLYLGNGSGSFTDNTSASGLAGLVTQGGAADPGGIMAVAAAADFDRDGSLEIVFAGTYGAAGPIRILKKVGGVYASVADTVLQGSYSIAESRDPAWVDVNNDGYLDLWIPSYRTTSMTGQLFINDKHGHLVYSPNAFGGWHASSIGSAWGDFNNDGFMDLALVSYGDTAQYIRLFRNKGDGTFANVTSVSFPQIDSIRGMCWGDYDNDGYADLLLGGKGGQISLLFHNEGDGTFTDATASTIGSHSPEYRSVQFVDFNNDGKPDIYLSYINRRQLLRNDVATSNHWIGFKPFMSTGENRAAIGTRFFIYAKLDGVTEKVQVRDIQAGGAGGSAGGNMWANFGLGAATAVDSAVAEWPDGSRSSWGPIQIDKYYSISPGTIKPPSITVAPDSFNVTLTEGDSTTDTLKIGNVGLGDLIWSAEAANASLTSARPSATKSKANPNWSRSNTAASGAQRHATQSRLVKADRISKSVPSQGRLLFIASDDISFMQQAKSAVISTGLYQDADIDLLSYPDYSTLSLTTLSAYSAVLVWTDGNFFDPVYVGDVLKQYADAGGGVVIATYAYSEAWAIQGGILSENYSPFLPGYEVSVSGTLDMTSLPEPNHPIFKGITSAPTYWTNSNYSNPVLNSGATLLAKDTWGDNVVAENPNGRVIGVVIFPAYIGADVQTNLLFANILKYVSKPSWLSLDPSSGLVSPSSSQSVDVKVNAGDLMVGKYDAQISINSNDPGVNPRIVPVHLTVNIGNRPGIVVAPASLGTTITGEGSQTLSFYVKNIGTQPLNFSISDTSFTMIAKHYENTDGKGRSTSSGNVKTTQPKILKMTMSGGDGTKFISKLKGNAQSQQTEKMLSYLNAPKQTSSVTWLSETPLSGTVASGDSVRIDVTFMAAGLPAGNYTASIIISSNDPFKPKVSVTANLSKCLENFTTDDNENNLLQGIPDYDMDVYLFNDDPRVPIEFNIFVIDTAAIKSAQLNLLAWDVDWANGERDSVVFNGHFVGYLTGADGEWSTSVFSLDPSWVAPGPAGKNLVQIYVDVLNPGYPTWAVTVDWGQLILNGSTGFAHIRYVHTDTTVYSPGSTVSITEEIDTDTLSASVLVETDLVDPKGNIVAGTNRTLTVTPGDEPFTEYLTLSEDAVPGQYQVMVIVYDATTYIQQDTRFVPFEVVLPSPYNVVAGTSFDGIVPLTWDLESDPYASPSQQGKSLNGVAGKANPGTASTGLSTALPGLGNSVTAAAPKLAREAGSKAVNVKSVFPKTSLAIDHYNVYRSTTHGGPYSLIGSRVQNYAYIDDGDFIDTTALNGQTYYYVVTAVYYQGESNYSQEVWATPAAGGQRLHSPFAHNVPVIDGTFSPGEWDDAATSIITMPGVANPVKMLVMNNLGTLFIAIEDVNDTSSYIYEEFGLYFDADNNHSWAPDTSEGNFWIDYFADSTYTTFRGILGTYPYFNFGYPTLNPVGVTAKAGLGSGHLRLEMAFDLSSPYFAKAADTLGLWVFNYDANSFSSSYYRGMNGAWPYGSIWAAPQTYGNLVLTKQKSFERPLASNWNLVSWNIQPFNDSTTVVLDKVKSNVVVALGFDQVGLTYDPTIPQNFNTLKIMDYLHGYWLKTNRADTLGFSGIPADPQTQINLSKSWNLVSYLPTQADSTYHALATVLDSAIVVQGFDGGALTYDPTLPPGFNTLNIMGPGYGYWIKTKTADTLIYPSTVLVSPSVQKMLASVKGMKKAESSVVPTRQWISLWGDSVKVNDQLIPVGTIVKAVDKKGTICGRFVVSTQGKFGLMPIYADDPETNADEGPQLGEEVNIYIGDLQVPAPVKWTQFGDVINFKNVLTAIGGELRSIPTEFALHQNYPNPFNPSTTIKYDLPKETYVTMKIYNVLGQEVITLVDGNQKAGYYTVRWNGLTRSGVASSGVYFCSIMAGNFNHTIKMLFVK